MKIYLIASSRQAAQDYCDSEGFSINGPSVRVLTRDKHARGINLEPGDGYVTIWRQGDRGDHQLFDHWELVVARERRKA